MPAPTVDERKLHELILYLAERMEGDDHAGRGRIKLAKLLWLSDFEAYRRFGRPITGARYVADELGPAPVEELLAVRDLVDGGSLEVLPGYRNQQLFHSLRPPDLSLFNDGEREVIEEMLRKYRTWTGKQLVDLAHEYPGWKIAKRGGEIPLRSVHISVKGPNRHDIARAKELARGIPRRAA